jgi:very-short-patch-repair endonuclease
VADIDRRLAEVARRQRMLITIDDVVAAGGGHHHVKRRLGGGRWVRVDAGVYLVGGAPLDWPTRMLSAVLAAGPGAAASHLGGARVLGRPGFASAGVELSIPRGRRYRRPDVRTHESTDLHLCRIIVRDGIPVTDPDRNLLDLGRYLGVRRLGAAVESARRDGLVTWPSLIAMHTAHARPGRHGIRRLRAVIAADAHRLEVTDTEVELLMLGLVRQAGLPEPVLHHRITDASGRFVAEVDLAFPQWRIAIECDGDVHLRADVRERDLPRQNDLVLLGWTVLRFSNERIIRHPDAVLRELRAAIAASR